MLRNFVVIVLFSSKYLDKSDILSNFATDYKYKHNLTRKNN